MLVSSFEIAEPKSLDDALRLLGAEDTAVRPAGGCTALMLMYKAGVYKPSRLVSLKYIGEEFGQIGFDEGARVLSIGATVTFSSLDRSAVIRELLPIVSKTMTTLANVRVRNVATVGGNLAHGDPHLDLPPVWVALDARVTIVSPTGERVIPVADLFAGYYETTLENNELITKIEVPCPEGWTSSYTKVTTRSAHDWPALGLAIAADIDGACIKDLRIVLSAAVDKPTRLFTSENILKGLDINDQVLDAAAAAATDDIVLFTDNRGSDDYKAHLLRVYLKRAVTALVEGAAE
jgi:carbon-monoxide dehydrogenase medium subunit